VAWPGHWSTVHYVDGRTRTIAIVFCGEIFWLMLIGVIRGFADGHIAILDPVSPAC
jgi:hypothetical protein